MCSGSAAWPFNASSASTSAGLKRSWRWPNSASSPAARSRASGSGGSVRLASTRPQRSGQRSSILLQQLEHLRVADAVQVVDHDQPARHLGRGQRVDELAGDVAQAAPGQRQRAQRLGRDAPRQVEGLERRRQAGEKALQRIVVVGADPGQRPARRQLADLPCQRRRLAVAGRCQQQRQLVLLQRLAERALQRLALDQRSARPRRLDLGQCESGGTVGQRHRRILAQHRARGTARWLFRAMRAAADAAHSAPTPPSERPCTSSTTPT